MLTATHQDTKAVHGHILQRGVARSLPASVPPQLEPVQSWTEATSLGRQQVAALQQLLVAAPVTPQAL